MSETILIIDDDQKLTRLLKTYLEDFGFKVNTADHPDTGLQLLTQKSPDLIILDIMLPDTNGFDLCKKIRLTTNTPIIMLTARGDVMDRVVGLELGADDYLPKPFEPRELVARIQSILRRATTSTLDKSENILIFNDFIIDLNKRNISIHGTEVELTTNEFTALELLVKHPGKVFDRDDILNELRGIDCEAYNRSVDITISRLRKKMRDDPQKPAYIKTIWGTGYVFIGHEKANE
jgi:DNA-binding response OmpR family regulator